jgi:hypothetical protein
MPVLRSEVNVNGTMNDAFSTGAPGTVSRKQRLSGALRVNLRRWKPWVVVGALSVMLLVLTYAGSRTARPQKELVADTPHGKSLPALSRAAVNEAFSANDNALLPSAPMIARSASLAVVSRDFQASRSSLETILARYHGYSAKMDVSTPENAPREIRASLRIPVTQLDLSIQDLRTLGRVENESQSGEEVSQQHADLVARLKNSREIEDQLRTILQQRTGKISDVLEVEEQIARVRGEIEAMEASREGLEHRIGFAAVELHLTEEYQARLNSPAASAITRMHNALVNGYRKASETLLGGALFVAEYGPSLMIWLVVLGLPGFLLWKLHRKLRPVA